MPIISYKQIGQNKQIGIWQIDESIEDLLQNVNAQGFNLSRLSEISNEQVKRQWLAVRNLLHAMTSSFCDITYDEVGRPHLDGQTYISITHSHEKVGIQLSSSKYAGIDLQHRNPSISKIKEKFMSPLEISQLELHREEEGMHIVWCAKETLFKALRSEGVLFAEELYIEPFLYQPSFAVQGTSVHGGKRLKFDMVFEKVEDYFLVYLVNP